MDSRTKGIVWKNVSSGIKVLNLADLVVIEFLTIKSWFCPGLDQSSSLGWKFE